MKQEQRAVDYFKRGFSCSQAVLAAFGEGFGLQEETSLRIGCGFGAGCGRLGLTCGAVAGAYMVIGMKYGKVRAEDNDTKEKTYAKVREFSKRFIERNRSLNCTELLGCDLGSPEGFDKARKENRIATICPGLVKDAAEILGRMLA